MSIFDRLNGGDMQSQIRQLQNDPGAMARQAGYNIPESLYNDPRAMVQHLIQTGQVSNPMLQRIMPMIQRMGK